MIEMSNSISGPPRLDLTLLTGRPNSPASCTLARRHNRARQVDAAAFVLGFCWPKTLASLLPITKLCFPLLFAPFELSQETKSPVAFGAHN